MRLLILGGTSWLGGAVASAAVTRGWEVTCLARGESGQVPPGALHVPRDRWQPGAYDELPDFDAAVEVSWQPALVRSAVDQVHAGHWVYVSSISAYDDEGSVLPAWDGEGEAPGEAYGGAKVACETAYAEALPESAFTIARAGLIGGYGDRSDRLGYWPARIDQARGERSRVLVPPRSGPVQVVDVLDLAEWIVHCVEERVAGTYDAVGHQSTLSDVLDAGVAASGTSPTFVEASSERLVELGVIPWMGPESLPLWIPGAGTLDRLDPGPAVAAGLKLRPLSETVVAALRWERERGLDRERRSGLSARRESDLLEALESL